MATTRRRCARAWRRCGACRGSSGPIATRQAPSPTRRAPDCCATWSPSWGARAERAWACWSRLDKDDGEAVAAALVVDDGDRAVVVAMAVDPEHAECGAATRLLVAEARAAIARGCSALDIVHGAGEYEPPPLPTVRRRALRLRIFNTSASASLLMAYGAVKRRVGAAREAPGAAAASARAAWSRIRTTAAAVASYGRFHLYRGELWIRGITATPGLELRLFGEADFDRLSETDRAELVESLEIYEPHCRVKWARNDLAVLATIDGRPSGVAWCARADVHIPELDRNVHPGPHECYIYDVFVAPSARGRAVAPSMLEFLAAELRKTDVYRSWALISPSNVASLRAFEKAAYAPVADIVYARMAGVERVTVRPPDPEAKQLLGLQ
jgi:GNAT superfamily N-acetyltransferase